MPRRRRTTFTVLWYNLICAVISMYGLPDIKDCPGGDILKCRFEYTPDYTPVVVFMCTALVIFMIPKLVELFNRIVFTRKKSFVPKAVKTDSVPFCCKRCRKHRLRDGSEEKIKIGAITPQNLANYKDMKQIIEGPNDDNLNQTEENVQMDSWKPSVAPHDSRSTAFLFAEEKMIRKKTLR